MRLLLHLSSLFRMSFTKKYDDFVTIVVWLLGFFEMVTHTKNKDIRQDTECTVQMRIEEALARLAL